MGLGKSLAVGGYVWATMPWRSWEVARLRRAGQAPLCVLLYHRVSDEHLNPWTLSNRCFERHVRWLKANFEIISLDEVQRRVRSGQNERIAVSLTFDDGYAENCQRALPLLIRHRIPCTYFVSLKFVLQGEPFPHDVAAGRPLPPNTPRQLRALAESGIDIGAHTRTHADLGQVTDYGRLRDEIVAARDELSTLVRAPIRYFAFPYGGPANWSATAFRLAKQAEFAGVCSAFGAYNMPGEDAFHIRRIHGDPGLIRLKNWLTLDPRKLHIGRAGTVDTAPRPIVEVASR